MHITFVLDAYGDEAARQTLDNAYLTFLRQSNVYFAEIDDKKSWEFGEVALFGKNKALNDAKWCHLGHLRQTKRPFLRNTVFLVFDKDSFYTHCLDTG